ncbi:MAG: hypothetical protein ACKN89_05015 [Cyanobium sp.]
MAPLWRPPLANRSGATRAASREGQDSPQVQSAEKGIADDSSHKEALR